MSTNYPLGKNQIAVIDALSNFDVYFKGCGWVYLYHSDTVEVLTALESRGLVRKVDLQVVETETNGDEVTVDMNTVETITHWILTEEGEDAARVITQFQKLEINTEEAA